MCPWTGVTGMKQALPPAFRLFLSCSTTIKILKTYCMSALIVKELWMSSMHSKTDTQITHSFEWCTWRCPQHLDIVHQVGCLPCPVSKHITNTHTDYFQLISMLTILLLGCELNSTRHLVFGFRFGIVGHFLYIVSWEEKLHLSAMVTFPPVASRWMCL